MEVAGKRVEPRWLGSIIRTTQPVGGKDTGVEAIVTGRHLPPGESTALGSSTSGAASLASQTSSPLKRSIFSPVPETGGDAVGAHSSRFLHNPNSASAGAAAAASAVAAAAAASFEPAVATRTSNDRTGVSSLLGTGGQSTMGGVLSPRERKVTREGVCKAVGGWVGNGYRGLDEPSAQLGCVQKAGAN